MLARNASAFIRALLVFRGGFFRVLFFFGFFSRRRVPFFFLSQGAAVIKDGGRRMFAGCGVLISGKFQPEEVPSNKHLMRRIL